MTFLHVSLLQILSNANVFPTSRQFQLISRIRLKLQNSEPKTSPAKEFIKNIRSISNSTQTLISATSLLLLRLCQLKILHWFALIFFGHSALAALEQGEQKKSGNEANLNVADIIISNGSYLARDIINQFRCLSKCIIKFFLSFGFSSLAPSLAPTLFLPRLLVTATVIDDLIPVL